MQNLLCCRYKNTHSSLFVSYEKVIFFKWRTAWMFHFTPYANILVVHWIIAFRTEVSLISSKIAVCNRLSVSSWCWKVGSWGWRFKGPQTFLSAICPEFWQPSRDPLALRHWYRRHYFFFFFFPPENLQKPDVFSFLFRNVDLSSHHQVLYHLSVWGICSFI